MPFRRSTRMFVAAFVVVLALDQITKALVRARLDYGESWPTDDTLVGQFFSFTHVQNTGVAFGMFQGLGNVFLITSILIAIGMMVYRRHVSEDLPWAHFAIGMIVAGALGNAIDRLFIGHVTDMFNFKFWPVFNVADASVFLGVLLLMTQMWREERMRAAEDAPAESVAGADAESGLEGAEEPAPGAPA